MISQIEHGKASPSVATLRSVAEALRMSMHEVFPELAAPPAPPRTAGVTRPAERPSITLESGLRWERLTSNFDPDVEFVLIEYPPGVDTQGADEPMAHAGCEYGYVVSGVLAVAIGGVEHLLGRGMSISFEASVPHSSRAVGGEPAVAIWFTVAPA